MSKPALQTFPVLLISCVCLLASACGDNIGLAFDRGNKGGGGGTKTSQVKAPTAGALVKDVRPRVLSFLPKGPGVAKTSPVAVLFSESMNTDSIFPSGGGQTVPGLYIAKKVTGNGNTTQPSVPTPIAATYDFLAAGRLVVMRPNLLEDETTYEILLGAGALDLDGTSVDKAVTLGEFATNPATTTVKPVVVTVFPPAASKDELRETQIYAIFNMPVTQASVSATTFQVRDESTGTVLQSAVSFPLRLLQQTDTRVARLDPAASLPGDVDIGIRLTDGIVALNGTDKLQVGTKDPFSTFHTIPFLGVDSIAVGNATPGFANRVNLNNVGNLLLDAKVGATAQAGDKLKVRIYGGDPTTKATGDLKFVERSQNLTVNGPATVTLEFGNGLGTPGATVLEDGALILAARLERGSQVSGYLPTTGASQDTVRPTLSHLGPPSGADPLTTFVTDLDSASLHGEASEPIGALSLVVGSATVDLFASADNRFTSRPFALGRQTVPLSFSLLLTDRAGNLAAGAITGQILQRGATTGTSSGGSLVVEAYDESTLAAVPGATVLVEPGMPAKPAVGRISAQTDSTGRVQFTGLAAPAYTVTIVASGFHLVTRLATTAGFVSLPLRPIANATATLSGSATYSTALGSNARVGVNVPDAHATDGQIEIPVSGATTIPPTAIRPRRPVVLSAFAGPKPPNIVPTFGSYSCALCPVGGVSGAGGALVAPLAPVDPGKSVEASLILSPATGTTMNYLAPYPVSLTGVAGLDTGNLAGPPAVLVQATLGGFHGTTPLGVGFASGSVSSGFNLNGTYSLLSTVQLASLAPLLWSSMQVADTAGNVGRQRAFFVNNTTGFVVPLGAFPSIPTVATPAGPFTGSPLVSFADRLDAAAVGNSPAFAKITARDPAGRLWILWFEDIDDASGNDTVQIPDLTGTGLVGLAPGAWKVSVETWQTFSTSQFSDDFVLEEIERQHMTYAASRAVDHTVN